MVLFYFSAHQQSRIEHKINSLALVSVEHSGFISDCSEMQNTSHGDSLCGSFQTKCVCQGT